MNSSQIHLALTHVPVILSFVGLVVLIVALVRKNPAVMKTSLYLLLAAGVFALPVYLTGEGAEEVVENMPGVSENIIESHEEFAALAMIIIAVTGVIAFAGIVFNKRQQLARVIQLTVLFLAIGSAAAMAQTAHLGGQIRHTEIRSGFIQGGENNESGKAGESSSEQKNDRDDDD